MQVYRARASVQCSLKHFQNVFTGNDFAVNLYMPWWGMSAILLQSYKSSSALRWPYVVSRVENSSSLSSRLHIRQFEEKGIAGLSWRYSSFGSWREIEIQWSSRFSSCSVPLIRCSPAQKFLFKHSRYLPHNKIIRCTSCLLRSGVHRPGLSGGVVILVFQYVHALWRLSYLLSKSLCIFR